MTRVQLGLARVLWSFLLLSLFVPPTWASPPITTAVKPAAAEAANWPTLAANPERTSWTAEEVRGNLRPIWYRPIEPFIGRKMQVIAANGLLYLSTARGLYALHADDGDIAWVYPTELPLGHSPTVVGDTLYVGGLDRKIHAISANPDVSTLPLDQDTGYRLNNQVFWTFEAGSDGAELGAGFETNPLVVGGVLYAGNRNGILYAVYANDYPDASMRGHLLWKFKTDGPIRFSAAYKDGVVYFASTDAHAYAVDASTGSLVWKSAELLGAGFHSYWPVIYQGWVVFAGSHNYRYDDSLKLPDELAFTTQELRDIYTKQSVPAGELIGPQGQEPGDWAAGTLTIDASRATDYFESKPWRRTYFVLNRSTGQEFTFDSDQDGKPEYAPVLWAGTHSGNRYPPVLGRDGVLYQQNNYVSDDWIARGGVSGWKFGTEFISRVEENPNAVDEPMAYAAGGSLIYWDLCCDREAGAFDITRPYGSAGREWNYYAYNLDTLIPGFDVQYPAKWGDRCGVYGNANGVYGNHGVQNPPIPYQGKLYLHKSNAIIALAATSATPIKLAMAATVHVQGFPASVSVDALKRQLSLEVQKMVAAGHLRPGYYASGIPDLSMGYNLGYLGHYFSNPSDTLLALIRALPYLSPELQQQARAYVQSEFQAFPPYQIAHIGWNQGASREAYETLPEVQTRMNAFGPSSSAGNAPWRFPQHMFYALWKYAEAFGGASELFNQAKGRLESPPSDSELVRQPYILNGYIAGRIGYLGLQKLAGEPESTTVRAELNRLLDLRVTTFSKDSGIPPQGMGGYDPLNISRNFVYLVPELGDYLRSRALTKVEQALAEYNEIAPAWFVSKYDATVGEGALQNLYDYYALFQARAYILKESREELVKHLDAPAFARGDLFYIQNLIAAIEASPAGVVPTFADVPSSHPYFEEIEALYRAGYTAGCATDPLRYCPDQTMNRAESSVFVERGIHTAAYDPPAPTSQVFADLALDSWAAKWVTGLWNDQYTAGCGTNPLIYCPWQGHTRAEGCVFYLRMLRGANYEPPQPSQQTFADVPLDAWYAKWVQGAYEAGLITPCQTTPELKFCPDGPLSRGLAAYMMVQAKGLR